MTEHSNRVDCVIIGAGVVGLSIAAELAGSGRRIFVFERNRTFGLETSSHNSEVIHAGIYYPHDSLKARFCVAGNPLMYEICRKYEIPHKKVGKIIVAADTAEEKEVDALYRQGVRNGLTDLVLLSRTDIKKLEPGVEATMGLLSPSTGILDVYSLMRCLQGRASGHGADIIYNTEVTGIEKQSHGFTVSVQQDNSFTSVDCAVVINCAGLYCDKVAALAGVDIAKSGYRIHFAKGEYFMVDLSAARLVARLVYPVPEQAGIGIHISVNMDGQVKLGPNVKWVDAVDYSVDVNERDTFYRAVHRYFPSIKPENLVPDFAGVRPKLQGPGDGFRDFIIRDEADKGLPGLIDLMGIESPGLTSSPAIARYVADIVKPLL